MAIHHIDWSALSIPIEGTAVGRESFIGALPKAAQTIAIEGLDEWPIGEDVAVDWYGDGVVTCTATVTSVGDEGGWTLTVKE
jgi:hypothetical protein